MNKYLYLIVAFASHFSPLLAQDDGPPPPPPLLKTPQAQPTPPTPPTQAPPVPSPSDAPPIVQPLSQSVLPPEEIIVPPIVPQNPSPKPPEETLYAIGAFPAGPRIKPVNLFKEGKKGSWLIGKFIVLAELDSHHYTIQSHVDSIGINLVDLANKIGAGRPVTIHLTIVDPPPTGLPHEFQYFSDAPLKITQIDRGLNEVSAIDLTRRR